MPISLNDSVNPAETNERLSLIQTLNSFAFILKKITGQSSWKVPPPLALTEIGVGAKGDPGAKGDKGDPGTAGINAQPLHPGFTSGKYYAHTFFASSTFITIQKNSVYYSYFYLPFTQGFNKIAFYNNTNFASTQEVKIAIYQVSSGLPTNLIADLGLVSFTTVGNKEVSFNLTLSPGWYVIAIQTSPNSMSIASPTICLNNLFGLTIPSYSSFNGFKANLNYGSFPQIASQNAFSPVATPLFWIKAD